MLDEEELDITKLKYVLYARKSTDDPGRQPKSIEDQIDECMELANRSGLHIIGEPLIETKSAKKPNKRPVFTQMLKDLKNGVYDGILSWNPDRLARNMREGGEIIDMIDEEQIKDLKFVTHHFSKDANGKMLLGLAFVLSKQYSDNLSQNVKRGVGRRFLEGKSPAPKHGYFRDVDGKYKSDGKNFELICDAWNMKTENISHEDIANYMNNKGYGRKTKTGRIIIMTKQILSEIFKDPFYYGILVQTNDSVDLRDLYDFEPAITEEIYIQVQELSNRRTKPYKTKWHTFLPLKTMIICALCGHNMYPGASKGNSRRYLFYRCDNKYCKRKKKSMRGKVIFSFIYNFLEKGLNFTEAEYEKYLNDVTKTSDEKRKKIRIEIFSREGRLKAVNRELKDIGLGLLRKNINPTVRKANEERLAELEAKGESLESDIKKYRNQLTDPKQDYLSIEEFLNLSNNASTIVKSANEIVKDQICRYIFLNLTVDEKKVLSYQAKEPFATLLEQRDKSSSADERTRTSKGCPTWS